MKACIFDLDGTLTDTLESLEYSVRATLREMGLQEITKEGARLLSGAVMAMADAEGLSAHKEAMRVRLC